MDTDKKILIRQETGWIVNNRILASCYFALLICVYLCSSVDKTYAQGLPLAPPQTVGMSAAKLNQIDALVEADIKDKKLPGAVVLVGHKGKIVFRKAFGNRSLVPTLEKMTVDTIFDVASLTKPIATATSIMILMEQGKLRLNDTIGKYLPDIDDPEAKKVTIQRLLTHTSGYRPDFDLGEKWTGREGMLAALKKEKLRAVPGTKFVYSDIGFIVLGEIASRVESGNNFYKGLNRIAASSIFLPLQLSDSKFFDLEKLESDARYAPTENVKGQANYLGSTFEGNEMDGNRILRGRVHDPTSFRMLGVAGHAGLFSTADDLARYCQMLLNGGVAPGSPPYKGGVAAASADGVVLSSRRGKNPVATAPGSDKGVRILSAQTVAKMTSPYVVSEDGSTRGLGWDINTAFSSNRGELFPLGSFGHTGFTGTSVWIDRVSQTFVVFLSNRVHPDGKGDVTPLRAKVATVVASAIENTPIEMYRLAENNYASQVAAQIPAFRDRVQRNAESNQLIANSYQLSANPKNASVLNGIDILERDKFKQLDGMRIGLVTNHTGRNLAGRPTIDILHEAKNLKLAALFAPEHGIRGDLDEEGLKDSKDAKTGLPIYSLYTETRRSKPEQLRDLDALVYDIQDVGVRFWTYTATLKNIMEDAAKAGKPVFILDRPNPIRGDVVEGPLAEEEKLSFVAAHTTPVRNGMTIGEHGMMMNAERKIGADVRVIKMENWSRAMWFDETGQTWVNPSPNMRSLNEATLYPGIGLFETTNISVGRGTDTPFEVIGAPWIDGQKFAKYMNERNLPGVRFISVRYTPEASVYKGENLGGVNIIVTDRKAFRSVRTGFEIAAALRKMYPGEWNADRALRLVVNQDILDRLKRGDPPEIMEKAWQASLDEFIKRRASFLLYK